MLKDDKKEVKKVDQVREVEERTKSLEEQRKKDEEQRQLLYKIKQMEDKKRKKAMENLSKTQVASKVYFDSWWVMRSAKIGKAHLKEIVRADMMARGLSEQETVVHFDSALEKYGVKLG